MLYLNPPFYIIDGVSLLPDHADPLQWYYMPLRPRITMFHDDALGVDVPNFQLVVYRDAAASSANGGIINFDVNLGLDDGVLDDIRSELRSTAHLDDLPRLAPVPLVDGSVHMILMGEDSTPPPTQPGATHPPVVASPFVVKMDAPATPALFGDNQAAFSAQLTQDGAVLMKQAIQGEMAPIGIVYQLDYMALRPAYTVTLKVDWDRVQHDLDENFGYSGIFFSADIDKAVDQLIENRAIDMQVDTFVSADDDPTVISDRDRAVNEVRDMITDAFFKPSIDPVHPEKDGWDKASEAANRVSQLAVTGGWSSIASFSYSHTDYTRIDKKRLDITMNERTTVRRTIAPQGHISGIMSSIIKSGVDVSKFVMEVDLNDPYFQKRTVNVIPRVNWAKDSVQSVDVDLSYGPDANNLIFDPAGPPQDKLTWSSIVTDGAMDRTVTGRFTVNFDDVDGLVRPNSVSSDEVTVLVDNFEVHARDLYNVINVNVVLHDLSLWQRWSMVEVALRYEDEDNDIKQQANLTLSSANPDLDPWPMYVRDTDKLTFMYQLTYRGDGRPDLVADWVTTDTQQVDVVNPLPGALVSVEVGTVVSWDTVGRVLVDVSYDDPGNGISYSQAYEFIQGQDTPQTFSIDRRDPAIDWVSFDATILYTDGHEVVVPHSITKQKRIFVVENMKGHDLIVIRSDGTDFAAKGVESVLIECSYEDTEAGLSFADSITLKTTTDQGTFEFDYVDAQRRTFTWQATYSYLNGLSVKGDPVSASTSTVLVPIN